MSGKKYDQGDFEKQRLEEKLSIRIKLLEVQEIEDRSLLNVVNRYCDQLKKEGIFLFNLERNKVSTSSLNELDTKIVHKVQKSERKLTESVHNFEEFLLRKGKLIIDLTEDFECDGAPSLSKTERQYNSEFQLEMQRVLYPYNSQPLFLCDVCSKTYLTEINVYQHFCPKKSTFECEVCHLLFSRMLEFEKHQATHYSNNKPKCKVCPQLKFSCVADLKEHIKLRHGFAALDWSNF